MINNDTSASSYAELMAYDCSIPDTASLIETTEVSAKGFVLYPNPTSGSVSVMLPTYIEKTTHVILYNSQGKIESKIKTNGEREVDLDMADLPAGLYFVNWQNSEQSFIQKLIKRQ